MKAIKYIPIVFLFVACGHSFHDSITGNGNVVVKNVEIDTVLTLIVSDRLEATLIPSDSFKVVIEADENLHEFIFVEEEHDQLHIYSDKYIRLAKAKNVYIYANSINSIDVSAGATLHMSDSLTMDIFSLDASSGSDVNILGHFGTMYVNGSSASDIDLVGSCNDLEVNMSSASDLQAYDFEAKRVSVTASSAADVRIHVTDEAEFDASSASDIIYRGNPEVISSNSSSAADIKRKRD